MIKTAHDGSDNIRSVIDLYWVYVSYRQHTETRFHTEEKITLFFYHVIGEYVTMKEILMDHVPSVDKPS